MDWIWATTHAIWLVLGESGRGDRSEASLNLRVSPQDGWIYPSARIRIGSPSSWFRPSLRCTSSSTGTNGSNDRTAPSCIACLALMILRLTRSETTLGGCSGSCGSDRSSTASGSPVRPRSMDQIRPSLTSNSIAAVTLARRTRSRGEWVVVHSDARGIQAELKDRLRKADTLSLVAFVVIICLPVLSWICLGRDPYRVLGVTPLDDMITIRRAFRRLHYQVYHDSGLEYD